MTKPRTIEEARRQIRIAGRAENLFTDGGYRMKDGGCAGCYDVTKPDGTVYYVYLAVTPGHDYCSCPSFTKNGLCKHWLAVKREIEQEEVLCRYHEDAEWGRAEAEDAAIERSLAELRPTTGLFA